MNMNGADASAAAGVNSTKENWHYTGPAFPTAFAQLLLANGGNNPNQIHMAAPGCAAEPTFSDQINAAQYVQATTKAVAPYTDPAAAEAAGYQPVSPTNYPVVYYVNPAVVAQNQAAGRTLDPAAVDGLVFATMPSGSQVLVAAMYLLPSTLGTDPPMPYRVARPMARADRRLRPDYRAGRDAVDDHRLRPLSVRFHHRSDALHEHGVAGACGRRSLGHPAFRHPDRGGGNDANELLAL